VTSSTALAEVEGEGGKEGEEEETVCPLESCMSGSAVRSSARRAVARQLSPSCSEGRAAVQTANARPGSDGVGGIIAPL
jgi:hypothetical protein